jgi:hypothetical protein
MGVGRRLRKLCVLAGLLLWLPMSALAQETTPAEPGPWAVTIWAGWGTDGDIQNIPGISSDFEESWFAGVGLTREIGRMGKDFVWEAEAIAVKHFGEQRHIEGDLTLGLRWIDPFWTGSLAVSTGVSLASRLPVLEERTDPPTKRFLQFLGVEAAFASKADPAREIVLRLHHRSAAYGLYGTHDGGSNFVALGYRQRF